MSISSRDKIISDITSADLTSSEFNIKNPSRGIVEKALDELSNEGHSYQYLDENPKILVNRLLKNNPHLGESENKKKSSSCLLKVFLIGSLITFVVIIFNEPKLTDEEMRNNIKDELSILSSETSSDLKRIYELKEEALGV